MSRYVKIEGEDKRITEGYVKLDGGDKRIVNGYVGTADGPRLIWSSIEPPTDFNFYYGFEKTSVYDIESATYPSLDKMSHYLEILNGVDKTTQELRTNGFHWEYTGVDPWQYAYYPIILVHKTLHLKAYQFTYNGEPYSLDNYVVKYDKNTHFYLCYPNLDQPEGIYPEASDFTDSTFIAG